MQAALPVSRHAPGRSGHRLRQRVVFRRSQDRAVGVLLRGVAPEPVLVRLEASDDWMPGVGCVVAGVLRRRRIAAADVPAMGAAPQVEPPAAGCSHSTQPTPLGGILGSISGWPGIDAPSHVPMSPGGRQCRSRPTLLARRTRASPTGGEHRQRLISEQRPAGVTSERLAIASFAVAGDGIAVGFGTERHN